ncbi:MAG TPA: MFS transporter [Bacteroidales bacterium]|nr:MFS transporter [Bacteroidales bacterium]
MSAVKVNMKQILPVFMSFIVMGFVDIVGVSAGYAQKDFNLTDSVAQLIPSMAFVWFFLLSVPTGLLLDRYGKKRILNIGMGVTGLGMALPMVTYLSESLYSFPLMLVAFILLGIGNTIVQVSANPLLHDVTPVAKFSSFMSLTQFVKAIISLIGPIIATLMASSMGDWKLVFAVYAITSFLAVFWLYVTKIDETKTDKKPATFSSCFKLLGNPLVLLMVLGIFLVVGSDVGMNSNIANYLQKNFDISLEEASRGISIYFAALMISRFLGAVLLNFFKPKPFLILTTLLTIVGAVGMILAPTDLVGKICIFVVGLGSGNLFPLIFSITVNKLPERVNEISGLMIMAVSGGAIIPPLMGLVSQKMGGSASIFVVIGCMIYILMAGLYARKAA